MTQFFHHYSTAPGSPAFILYSRMNDLWDITSGNTVYNLVGSRQRKIESHVWRCHGVGTLDRVPGLYTMNFFINCIAEASMKQSFTSWMEISNGPIAEERGVLIVKHS